MRIEVTGRILTGRCDIRTVWCHARACGALGTVMTPDGKEIRVCGSCLAQMSAAGTWYIPGTRPHPWPIRRVRDEGEAYIPNPDAIIVEPTWTVGRGRCNVQMGACEARECGLVTAVTMPDCSSLSLCGACLEKMARSGVWDLGRSGGAAVAEVKRLAQFEAAAPAA